MNDHDADLFPEESDAAAYLSARNIGVGGTPTLSVEYLGQPGWVELRYFKDSPTARIFVKFEKRDDGRVIITRLVAAGDMVDSSVLRAIPISHVESLLNVSLHNFTQPLDAGGVHGFVPDVEQYPVAEVAAVDVAVDSLLAKPLSATATGVDAAARHWAEKRQRRPLRRPTGVDPEGFSRRVAEAYNDVIRTTATAAPAKVLAEEASVPVVTVHRWIADARRRGFLPPARKGRAG